MVNMSIPYRRANYSLQTLQTEIRTRWPGREQNKGFVSGYKAAGNFTGHNADNNGICHAYDIGVDIEHDGTGLKTADAEWLANYLRTECNPRFQYLIYNRRIAGNHTGWNWAPYTGASPHTDHIHISTVDLYWGESSGVAASVYDSTAPWGLLEIKPAAAAAPKPIRLDLLEEIMALDRNSPDYRNFVSDIAEAVLNERIGYGEDKQQFGSYVLRTDRNVAQIERLVRDLPAAVLDAPVELAGPGYEGATDARTKIAWLAHEQHRIVDAVEGLNKRLDAIAPPEGTADETLV